MDKELRVLINKVNYAIASTTDQSTISILNEVIDQFNSFDDLQESLEKFMSIAIDYQIRCKCQEDGYICKPCFELNNYLSSKYSIDPNQFRLRHNGE